MSSRSQGAERSRPRVALRWIALAVAVVALGVAGALLPTGDLVRSLQRWIDGLGAWRHAAFVGAYLAAALLFVPGSALTLVAGAVFGLWLGTLLVAIAATAAAAIAFLIARHLARGAVERALKERPKFAAVDRAIKSGGWKVVGLLRLSPVVPFSASNYLFGLTSVDFVPYVVASAIGMLPGTFTYVYLGHVGAAGIAGGEKAPQSALEWTLLGAGLVATIVLTVLITRLARRELRRHGAVPGERK